MTQLRQAAAEASTRPASRWAVSYGQYARCFPVWSTVGMAALALGILILYRGWLLSAVVWLFAGAVCLATDWLRFRRRISRSRLCPAQVVSESPYLVAVWSDLSPRESATQPAIMVFKEPLQRMTGGAPARGARLAALVAFGGDPHAERWDDVSPIIVNCCMQDRAAIRDALAGITDQEWQRLEDGLSQLSHPTQPGLYPVALLRDEAVGAIEDFEVEPRAGEV